MSSRYLNFIAVSSNALVRFTALYLQNGFLNFSNTKHITFDLMINILLIAGPTQHHNILNWRDEIYILQTSCAKKKNRAAKDTRIVFYDSHVLTSSISYMICMLFFVSPQLYVFSLSFFFFYPHLSPITCPVWQWGGRVTPKHGLPITAAATTAWGWWLREGRKGIRKLGNERDYYPLPENVFQGVGDVY